MHRERAGTLGYPRRDAGELELRVCAACGFAEWWAHDLAALAAAAVSITSNVRVLSATTPGYR